MNEDPTSRHRDLKMFQHLIIDNSRNVHPIWQTDIMKYILKCEQLLSIYNHRKSLDITKFREGNTNFNTSFIQILYICALDN